MEATLSRLSQLVERTLSLVDRQKIALFCNVPVDAVIEEKDKDFSIYEVPLSLVDHGLDELIVRRLGLTCGTLELDDWRDLLHRLHQCGVGHAQRAAPAIDRRLVAHLDLGFGMRVLCCVFGCAHDVLLLPSFEQAPFPNPLNP